MKIIDLSIPIEDGLPSDPPIQIPKIQYCNHKDTAEQMAGFFKGCTVEDLPEGNGWGIEFLQVCTHSGTHVDAPYHYYPTMNGGERAWTIDEVPLDWFVGDGVVMDFHDKPDGYKITAKDVEEYFQKINYTLKPGDIVFLRTDADDRWGKPEYLVAGAGMSYEATMWLLGNLFSNIAAKPDFIAYRFSDRDNLCLRWCRKFYHVQEINWTIRTKEEMEAAEAQGNLVIFECFDPKG